MQSSSEEDKMIQVNRHGQKYGPGERGWPAVSRPLSCRGTARRRPAASPRSVPGSSPTHQGVVAQCAVDHSWARDNAAATTCFQTKQLWIIPMGLNSLWLLYLDTEALQFFRISLVTEAVLRCRVVAELKNGRVSNNCNWHIDDGGDRCQGKCRLFFFGGKWRTLIL